MCRRNELSYTRVSNAGAGFLLPTSDWAKLAYNDREPKKVMDGIRDLLDAGFYETEKGGKESHRKFTHRHYSEAVTISGREGHDAKLYQEK
jgi:predicted RNA binding protein YcfA (HicA-like mRNA interferase family)